MGRPKVAAHGFLIFSGHGGNIRHGLFYVTLFFVTPRKQLV
ncbi:MAG: hypothetical protein ABFD82_10135 [Syntrophaceae bacterium]